MATDFILGTAGHIDHGKTSLVKALTGVDTDRLPEEKKRGITIDLGFAELVLGDVRLGIVDVPGHERFVRNMLAGAAGIDLALLVVAADDSVKPQTREHFDILRMLDLSAGVIALTKCDLPDADWIDLVEQEVRELVAGSFLEAAPVLRTSAHTGEGLAELRDALAGAASTAASTASARRGDVSGPFRMAIDRTFTLAGHGTVVTGSVGSGEAAVGDALSIEPGGISVRVRGLGHHDRPVHAVHRGQRAAINLAGVHHDEIRRGHELATPGFLQPSRLISARLQLSGGVARPLKSRTRVRVHLGTAETMASVVLLDRDQLKPAEQAPGQLYLSEPVVATWNQPLVLRSESPVMTIGGGHVLEPVARKLRKSDTEKIERLADLSSADPLARAAAALRLVGAERWETGDLTRMVGAARPQKIVEELLARGELVPLTLSPSRSQEVQRGALDDMARRVESVLAKMHEKNPRTAFFDRARVMSYVEYLGSESLVAALLEWMESEKRIQSAPRGVALTGTGPQLSAAEQTMLEAIVRRYREAGFRPPSVKEIEGDAEKRRAAVGQLITLAAAQGHLVEFSAGLFLHAEVELQARTALAAVMAARSLSMSEIREILETTRKYAVPYCEYLDRIGFTRRDGDQRSLAQ